MQAAPTDVLGDSDPHREVMLLALNGRTPQRFTSVQPQNHGRGDHVTSGVQSLEQRLKALHRHTETVGAGHDDDR